VVKLIKIEDMFCYLRIKRFPKKKFTTSSRLMFYLILCRRIQAEARDEPQVSQNTRFVAFGLGVRAESYIKALCHNNKFSDAISRPESIITQPLTVV
jgi:hypothetical protein